MPTLAEVATAPLPTEQPVDGESFVKLLEGGQALRRESIFWHFPLYLAYGDELLPIYGTETRRWRAVPSSIIRKGDFKLIYYYEYERFELFNLQDDLSEEHDLSLEMPVKAQELLSELTAWVRNVDAPVPHRSNPRFVVDERLDLDELRLFGRFVHRRGLDVVAGDDVAHSVEVAGADLALVPGRGVAVDLAGELALLQLGVGGHAALAVAARQLEHAVVERVEAGQRDELELVAHRAELALELGDGRVVEVACAS